MAANDQKSPGQLGKQKQRQDAQGNKILDPQEELALLEKEIHELKIAFEQYFIGIDRHSPARRRDVCAERFRRMKASGTIRNTALRFRLEQIHSKFSSYDRMWTRTLTEIENGTYRRDVFLMKHRQQARAAEAKDEKTPLSQVGKPPPPADPSLSDGQLRQLYDTYIMAKQRTNESTSGISYESLSSTLRRQVPELLNKYECKAIDFKVVIKGGKALLKAVPRK